MTSEFKHYKRGPNKTYVGLSLHGSQINILILRRRVNKGGIIRQGIETSA